MPIKIFAAFLAVALLLAYVSPMVFKLRDTALAGVILIGIITMLVDLVQSLRDGQD